MKLTHQDYDSVTVVKVHGDLTAEGHEQLRQLAADKLRRNTRDFVLDVAETELVDSQGLEALLWLQEQCGQKLGQVRLVGAGENLTRILHLTRLAPRFDHHADLESAVKSLRI